MPARVSVLLPVYQAQSTLAACLRSLLRQSLPDWECVAVDDGSRDASLSLLRALARDEPRLRILARPHRGLVPTLRAGLAECRAPFVARMDADDWMHRDRLRAQLEALASDARLDAVGCHVRLFPRAALGAGMRAYERWLLSIDSPRRVREECFVECPIAHPTLFARREILQELGYRDSGWAEDYDLLLRLLQRGGRVGVVPRRLLAWRHGPGRLSRTHPSYRVERFTACKAAFLAGGFLAGVERYVLWGYGGTGRSLCRELRRLGKRPEAIVELHPGRLGNRIHGAPVLPPESLRAGLGLPLVVSVAGVEARQKIRLALADMGYRETEDYVCAA